MEQIQHQIQNYEQYCEAFQKRAGDAGNMDGQLLLYIQNWIERMLDMTQEDTADSGLQRLLEKNADKTLLRDAREDALSRIVDDCQTAFRVIAEHMREEIIRENVRMPVYKVKQINSYGLNWLSRRSGTTIRQKASAAGHSVMAVQRRITCDTRENRLFVAFAQEMYRCLQMKLDYQMPCREEEQEFYAEIAAFLHREEVQHIQKWENQPPNHVLLSNQYYKKIWYSWNEVKKLDERIRQSYDHMDDWLAEIFLVELLTQTKDVWKIPQMPVKTDRDSYQVTVREHQIYGLDEHQTQLLIWKKDHGVSVKRDGREIRALFANKKIILFLDHNIISEFAVHADNMGKCVQIFLAKAGFAADSKMIRSVEQTERRYQSVWIDLCSVHPQFIADGKAVQKLPERMLMQRYLSRDKKGNAVYDDISCEKTNAVQMVQGVTETYTVFRAVENGSIDQLQRLMYRMKKNVSAVQFTFIFPDAWNVFQLDMVYQAADRVYPQVLGIPLSIGAAFAYQITKPFQSRFHAGDFLLVMDLIQDEITMTLLGTSYDEQLEYAIPEGKGIVWERYPTASVSCRDKVQTHMIDALRKTGCEEAEKLYRLFGLDGLCEEVDRLSFFFSGGSWYEAKENVRELTGLVKIDITEEVSRFLAEHCVVTSKTRIHVISMAEQLVYQGKRKTIYKTKADVLNGCQELERLRKQTDLSLWRDYLPGLALKKMYGSFALVRDGKAVPGMGRKQDIAIESTFLLSANCKEYHFKLVQGNRDKDMHYEAVIQNPAFPLKQDTECRLRMTYQYGTEESYELVFLPLYPERAGFAETKAAWSRINEYPYLGLDSPEFPRGISWEEAKNRGIYEKLKEAERKHIRFADDDADRWKRLFLTGSCVLNDSSCPEDFRQEFMKVVQDWTDLFYQYEEGTDRCRIFTCLSLAAKAVGRAYYVAADVALEMYRFGEMALPYEIGCALGDLSQRHEQELLDKILLDVEDPVILTGILARALWHNEQFVYHADQELLLEHFQKAIEQIGELLHAGQDGKLERDDQRKIGGCLVYILGVLRLRTNDDPVINKRYLSLNNEKMQDLYRYVERMVDANIRVDSFLKLEIRSKGVYQNIRDLLYVLLVYITGQCTEGTCMLACVDF